MSVNPGDPVAFKMFLEQRIEQERSALEAPGQNAWQYDGIRGRISALRDIKKACFPEAQELVQFDDSPNYHE